MLHIFKNLKIGTVFDVPIILHESYPIFMITLFVCVSLQKGIDVAFCFIGFITMLHFFVIVHEYGHILVARKFGIGCQKIYLTPLGGIALLQENEQIPKEEFLLTIAGPLTHVGWLLLFYIISFVFNVPLIISFSSHHNFLSILASMNVFICAFNLIPAFPMDGGRIYRSLAVSVMRPRTAMLILAFTGPATLLALGIYLKNIYIFIIFALVCWATKDEFDRLEKHKNAQL